MSLVIQSQPLIKHEKMEEHIEDVKAYVKDVEKSFKS